MREQWFSGYLPVFIIILMEVILMSNDGQGASTARPWLKEGTGNSMKMERSGDRYQWGKQNDTNKTIPARGKSAHRIKQRRIDRDELNDSLPELPLESSSPPTISQKILVDYLLPDSDEQSSESQSVDDPPMNLYPPMIDEIRPNAVLDMGEMSPNPELDDPRSELKLKSNDLDSLLALALLDPNIIKIASLLMSQEDINALRPIPLKRTFSLLVDLFYLTDFTVGITCGLLTGIIENLKKPYIVMAKEVVHLIFNLLGMLNPFKVTDPSDSDDVSNNLFITILNYLNPFKTDTGSPPQHTQNPILLLIDYLNPFKPVTKPPASTPSTPVEDSHNPLILILDFLNPFKPATEPPVTTPSTPVDGSKNPLILILDYLNPFKPATEPTVTTPSTPVDDSGNPLLWIIDYINPFKPSTEPPVTTPSTPVDNDKNLLVLVLDLLNPFKPATEPPVTTPSTPVDVDDSRNPLLIILDYLNPFKPSTEPTVQTPPVQTPPVTTPSTPVDNDKNLLVLVLDLLNPFKPSTEPPVTTTPTPVESPENPLVLIIDYFNPFKPATEPPVTTPSAPVDSPKNPLIIFLEYLHSYKPTTETPLEPGEKPQTLLNLIINYFDLCETGTDPNTPALLVEQLLNHIESVVHFFDLSDIIREIIYILHEFGPETDLSQPFRPYINPIEDYILQINPWGIFGEPLVGSLPANARLKPLQPNNRDTDSLGSNTDVLKPARDQPQPNRSVGVTVDPSLQPIDSVGWESSEVTDSPASDSRPDSYLPTQNHSWRPAQEANDCPNIPSDYHQVKGTLRAYKLHITHLNWNDAQLKCKEEDGNLALPEDRSQYDDIIGFAKSFADSSDLLLYAGFHRMSAGGNWTTISGDPLPFEKWANDTADDDLMDKQCGGLIISDNDIDGFIGEVCTELLPFVCEIIIPLKCA